MSTEESLSRAEELLARLEAARGELDRLATEGGGSPDRALEILSELSELAKSVEEELERAKRSAEAVRRGGRDPRGRCAACGGVPSRDVVRDAAGRARARGSDTRDDRRAVPRHHRHRTRRGDAAQPEDGRTLHSRRRPRTLGRAR